MAGKPKVRTCLWFDHQALTAAELYVSLLPGSRMERIGHYPEGQEMAAPGAVLEAAARTS